MAKFGAGLIVADFITMWWFSVHTMPKMFLGLALSDSTLTSAMVIDIFIFLILVHYGWNIGKIPQVKERMYLTAAGAIFTVVALGHLTRVLYQGDFSIFGWDVPIFVSWLGVIVATYLAYASFHFAARIKGR